MSNNQTIPKELHRLAECMNDSHCKNVAFDSAQATDLNSTQATDFGSAQATDFDSAQATNHLRSLSGAETKNEDGNE